MNLPLHLVRAAVLGVGLLACGAPPRDAFGKPVAPSAGVDGAQRIGVSVEPAPPIGSTLFLRRVALRQAREGHNDSHVVQNVCQNDGGELSLDDPLPGASAAPV